MPYVPLEWLSDYVDVPPGATPESIAAALVKVGLEEEGVVSSGLAGPLVVGRVLSAVKETASNGKSINYCRVDVGAEHNDPTGPGKGPDAATEYPPSRGIVCGAHNFAEGDLVTVVLPGATLPSTTEPGGFKISARKTYGHISDGMICSRSELNIAELGIGDDHDGILVLASASGGEDGGFDGAAIKPGDDAIALLGLDAVTLEINITPDRGYCFSMRGVAREYSHSTGGKFTDPGLLPLTGTPKGGAASSNFAVELDDKAPIRGNDGCDRFAARVLRGFDPTAASPQWMQQRLTQSGMRPISLVVDVTNYVMLELGVPLHAYDLGTLTAPIVVRRAAVDPKTGEGEKLVTLEGTERTLHPEDMVVADSQGGHGKRAVGLGGVMGGLETEITDATTDVLLEGAHWDPVTIARTSRRHKMGSEASKRGERGVDTALAPVAIERALTLMQEFGGGEVEDVYTDINTVAKLEPIEMAADFPDTIVGFEYGPVTVRESLEKIGCVVAAKAVSKQGGAGANLSVLPPTWRPDLRAPIDLVEEVARLHGYDDLPSALPTAPAGRGYTHGQQVRRNVARSLAEHGLTEVQTYPFISEERLDDLRTPADDRRRNLVKLANPLNEQLPYLRPFLFSTLVDAAKVNLGRGAVDVAIFEVGKINRAEGTGKAGRPGVDARPSAKELAAIDAALPHEDLRIGGILAGNRVAAGWNDAAQPVDWSDALAAAMSVVAAAGVEVEVTADAHDPFHPGRCAALYLKDGTSGDKRTLVGHAGEIHPKVLENLGLPARSVCFEISLDTLIAASEGQSVRAVPVLTQPLAKEDFAFVVDAGLVAESLVATVRVAAGDLLEDAHVFDVYMGEQVGEGKKSLAVNVKLRAADRTLDAEEILGVRKAIITGAEKAHGAVLR